MVASYCHGLYLHVLSSLHRVLYVCPDGRYYSLCIAVRYLIKSTLEIIINLLEHDVTTIYL